MTDRDIEEEKYDCHIKSHPWFDNKRIQLVVHEHIPCLKDKLSAQRLVKAKEGHLSS